MLRFVTVVLAAAWAWPAAASTYEVEMPPKPGEKYRSAKYRLWLPDGVKTLRAIVVRQHGCGRDGIDHANDLQWQALAKKHDAALLGTQLTYSGQCGEWCIPSGGTERAFLDALAAFAEQSKHPELATVPWAIWGHSGGAIWSCHMADRFPERVVGVWARSGAVAEYGKGALAVPIVFNYGKRESEPKNQFEAVFKSSTQAFERYRPQGALWALAVDPLSWHDTRNSRNLAARWFDTLLTDRLSKDGPKLRALMDDADRRRADPKSLAVTPGGDSGFGKSCWLPSEAYAAAWVEYCKTGDVIDATAPPAPTDLAAVAGPDGVTLTWRADADVESGVKGFAVVRDGKRLALHGSPKSKSNPKGLFQTWDFGDEPIPRLPALRYVDADGKSGAKYELIQINGTDLESKPTAAIAAN